MKVKEVIKQLKGYTPEAEAVIEGDYDEETEQYKRNWIASIHYDNDEEGEPDDNKVVIG